MRNLAFITLTQNLLSANHWIQHKKYYQFFLQNLKQQSVLNYHDMNQGQMHKSPKNIFITMMLNEKPAMTEFSTETAASSRVAELAGEGLGDGNQTVPAY